MKVEDFEKRLAQNLESVLMTEENGGSVAIGFNCGARAMFYSALLVAREIAAENAKGAN